MFRTIILIVGMMMATANSADACPMADAAAFQEAAEKVKNAEGSKATFVLSGMTGGSCSGKVADALNAIDGVVLSAVDYQTGRVEVAYDAKKTTVSKLEETLVGTGYSITEKPS